MPRLETTRFGRQYQNDDGPSSDEIISQGPPEAGDTTDEAGPIGVPEDWSVSMRSGYPWAVGGPNAMVEKKPLYFDGDEYDPARGSPESIFQLQQKMAEAGILTTTFKAGYWDQASLNAYRQVLGFANRYGVHSSIALTAMQANQGVQYDPTTGEFVDPNAAPAREPLVIRQSDPETLRQIFRNAVIDTAGEGWSREEINSAVQSYRAIEAQRQRQAYDMQLTGGTVSDIPAPDAWIEAEVERKEPGRVAAERGLGYLNEFETLLGGWRNAGMGTL